MVWKNTEESVPRPGLENSEKKKYKGLIKGHSISETGKNKKKGKAGRTEIAEAKPRSMG